MTLGELVTAAIEQGANFNTKVVLYIKSESIEPEVFVSAEDHRLYLMER